MTFGASPSPRLLRRIAYLRELASLGVHRSRACELLGLFPAQIYALKRVAHIEFPRKPHGTAYQREITRRFEAGESPARIAAALDRPPNSVSVTLCKLGLTSGRGKHDPFRYSRGFSIPDDRRNEYKSLRELGLTVKECGYEMGLLVRPSASVSSVNTAHKFSEMGI